MSELSAGRNKGLWTRHGRISGLLIDEQAAMPSSAAFRHRFGSFQTHARAHVTSPAFFFSSRCSPPLTPAQFMDAIGGLLTVRSDTFRIRTYGEAVNPLEAGRIEATGWCEATVQRMPDPAPGGAGRRFVVTYFRWLGPDDI